MYNKAVIINSETLGRGDDGVGHTLLGVFLRKVLANPNPPDAIIFYNSGVKLLGYSSHYIDILQALEEKGIELLACGTCVYSICGQHKLRVGRISNMEEITSILLRAKTVITL
ncbi:MAG: response regulator SirA [Epulopiscium sp. Nele67-Bin005]|nr:MAG: response regulator SirA [Epulopiscium sp. Nele67-Bin005]